MSTTEPTADEGLPARLAKASAELRQLEQAIKAGDIDLRILHEFRQAVDHVRHTAWALQQWFELQAQRRDAYTVLPQLTADRIRRATQLCNELALDLDTTEVTFETEGLDDLLRAVEGVFQRLARFFKK